MGGGGQAPNIPRNTERTIQAYTKYLPGLLQATSDAQPGINQTQAQSASDILSQFGPMMARLGQELQQSNSQAGANTVGSMLTGQGGDNVRSADALNREINPEYYSNRATASKAANDLIGSINLNGLSPGEATAVERGINKNQTATGNLGNNNATNIVSNAMQFGDRMSQKRAELAGAIGTANSLAPNQQSTNFGNVMAGATSQPNSSTGTNFGLSSLPLSGGQAFSAGQGLLGGLTGIQGQNQQFQWDASHANSSQGMAESVAKGISCCFIFLEATNGKLPWYVRVERDKYYEQLPRVATGYKKMAKWLVPLMQKYSFVKSLVNFIMVKPITKYGGWKHYVNECGILCYPFKAFWFTVWRNI